MFEGFPEDTVRFFLDLRFHNEASFFNEHRDDYENSVRQPFYDFIDAMAPAVKQVADDMEVRPAKCLARIRRDTRFSKDKTPYRDHLWLLFRRGGETRDASVMYWFELSPEDVAWGLGFWAYNRPAMDALRRRMVHKPEEVLAALKEARVPDRNLEIYGDRYQRMNPPVELPQALQEIYPLKEIYIKRTGIPLKTAYTKDIVTLCSEDVLRLKPMYQLLRKAADEGMATLDA
ncbi:MAG: DUF2461 domain-containing protein [Eubacteriales bacterium]|nr:DUF2461 domain-containing protein [Eubacteriales bacterium]